ncbi:MAG: hypothetical protein HYT61_03535 [Candidatus Yanofskybacteria bacterium]|nr:hypothetical protein [Candidatus Yanofskybacteria bacterium]
MSKEATIMIGSTKLNEAQSMAIRVAVSNMLMELQEPGYCQELGEIAPLYKARLSEVQEEIHRDINK